MSVVLAATKKRQSRRTSALRRGLALSIFSADRNRKARRWTREVAVVGSMRLPRWIGSAAVQGAIYVERRRTLETADGDGNGDADVEMDAGDGGADAGSENADGGNGTAQVQRDPTPNGETSGDDAVLMKESPKEEPSIQIAPAAAQDVGSVPNGSAATATPETALPRSDDGQPAAPALPERVS